MTQDNRTLSPAMEFITSAWKHTIGGSNERLRFWEDVYYMAIAAGMRFDVEKDEIIGNQEGMYAEAVASKNTSAAKILEKQMNRTPWMANDVEPKCAKYLHCTGCRKRSRLSWGCNIHIANRLWTVTCINDIRDWITVRLISPEPPTAENLAFFGLKLQTRNGPIGKQYSLKITREKAKQLWPAKTTKSEKTT